ncbi:MAG: hypothetical protein AAGA77_21975 [Bacteroidota bacterium]
MRRPNHILLLSLAFLALFLSCNEECNDCLELTTKSIRYVDSNGTNLLFGDQAVYNPDNVQISAENKNEINFWIEEEEETILFNLEKNITTYTIVLSESVRDVLDFELDERKSTQCCGNMTYSTKTFLNGQEIENNDVVIITR